MNNLKKKTVVAAQLSSVHSKDELLHPDLVRRHVEQVVSQVPLDILIVGWEEKEDLFHTLTSKEQRMSDEVYLWYPFLSDYPGFSPSHLVVNMHDLKSRGWDGYDGTDINESFKQSCPNNPEAVSVSLNHLERLLAAYDFDGVFIDKIRFPSMANGLQDFFTCFCPYCMQKAAQSGIDLEEVKYLLENKGGSQPQGNFTDIPSGAPWLEVLLDEQPLLKKFLRFRADSINHVISKISETVDKMEKKLSLDVFSPGLAPLVGQDFAYMGHYAEWVKPMIYRFGNGPSSLRSEIPSLVKELGGFLGIKKDDAMQWCVDHVKGLKGVSLNQLENVAPLSLLLEETHQAVDLFHGTSVYLGLETVFISGQMEILPKHIEEILEIGEACGVQGYVLSWDLLHTPVENVLPLKSIKT